MGGMITFLLVAGVVSYKSSLQAIESAAAKKATQRIQKLETDAEDLFESIRKQEQEASDAVLRILDDERLLKRLRLPIGTIVPSMLDPNEFAEAVGDPNRTTWVLADGNDITDSQYGKLSKKKNTPDLRGMFLRGVNEGRKDGKQDSKATRTAGDYQADALQQHGHATTAIWPVTGYLKKAYPRWDADKPGYTAHPDGKNAPQVRLSVTTVTGPKAEAETRPKNVAVYFYIKIN